MRLQYFMSTIFYVFLSQTMQDVNVIQFLICLIFTLSNKSISFGVNVGKKPESPKSPHYVPPVLTNVPLVLTNVPPVLSNVPPVLVMCHQSRLIACRLQMCTEN